MGLFDSQLKKKFSYKQKNRIKSTFSVNSIIFIYYYLYVQKKIIAIEIIIQIINDG